MSGRLEGKRAFITAAGQGIGRAIIKAFVAEGADESGFTTGQTHIVDGGWAAG